MKKLPLLMFAIGSTFPGAIDIYNQQDEIIEIDSLIEVNEVSDSIESNFDNNLDSMVNLYYIDQQLPNISNTICPEVIPDFPDSVYIQRLSSIPSVVELSYNPVVRNYIHAYTMKNRRSVEVMLGLSEYYFPIFDDIFDYYKVPNEMKYMSIIESALNPRACSRTRAMGLWQFMFGTGRVYGLEVNSLVDERCDPIKSTHAAARYARDLYNKYGDWILVIAAYNCGPGNVNKAIRRSGGKTNYWDIYYYLPRETRGHVPAFIAATYVMHFYQEHNLIPAKVDYPEVSDTLYIRQRLHLQQVADVLNIPIQQLRDLNPQYRYDIVPSEEKKYYLRIPEEYVVSYLDLEDSIYAYKDSIFFDPEKLIITPSNTTHSTYIPKAPGKDYQKLYYTVKSGDNLGYIAEWYDVGISDIKHWNNIYRTTIRAGQKLVIYKHKNKIANYKSINALSFAEKQARIGKTVQPVKASTTTTPSAKNGNYVMYTVKSGDNLWTIAKKYPGVSNTDIMQLNNISDASKIRPGQQLKIKPKS